MNSTFHTRSFLKKLRARPARFIFVGILASLICVSFDAFAEDLNTIGNVPIAIPIEISSMTVSASDHIDGHSHTTALTTNVDFSSVEWRVDNALQETQTGPASKSTFTFNYAGYGSPTGKSVLISVCAVDANGDKFYQSETITVWSSSTSIGISSISTNASDFAEDDTCTVSLQTDVGFWYVYWYVDGKYTGIFNGPADSASFTPSLSGLGLSDGKKATISATAYSINTNGVLGTATSSTDITVWSDAASISIESFDIPDSAAIGNSITAQITTDIPFDRVDWYVDGVCEKIDDPSPVRRTSSFTYTFNGDGGWEDGGQCVIKAVAFGVGEVANDWDDGIMLLHIGSAGLTSVEATVVSTVLTGEDCVLTTRHSFEYYSTYVDGRIAYLRCEANWWTGRATIAKMDASVTARFSIWLELSADRNDLKTYEETLEATATFEKDFYYSAEAKTILDGPWDAHGPLLGLWGDFKIGVTHKPITRSDKTPIRFFNGVTWE